MGNGSVGSRTYWDVPVIHALPVIVGTTASSPATVVASTSRPMNGRSSRDVVDEVVVEAEQPAGVQLGHARAGAGAARGAVEPAGLDHHRVPGVLGGRPGGDELDVVAAVDPRLSGMHRGSRHVDRVHDRARPNAISSRACSAAERDADLLQLDDRVEVAAEGHVVAHVAVAGHLDVGVERGRERGDVADGHALGAAVAHRDLGDDQPGRGVQADRGDRLVDLDHAGLDEHRRHADRAVPAHRQAARRPRCRARPSPRPGAWAAAGSPRSSRRGRAART